MKRYSPDNDTQIHDLLVIGGGIYGASMAYTSTLNGLQTVLVEQDDFGQHTSANSQKVIHGGLRYLQTMDIKRVVESIREKQRFYHLFPHQVKPLPCLLPTTGFTMKGTEAFRIAFLLYSMIEKLVCRGKLTKNLHKRPTILTKKEVDERFSHMKKEDIRGGALWYDGICEDPERVFIALMESAAKLGAEIANQMKVVKIERTKNNHLAVHLYDKLSKKEIRLFTKKIAICTGSWFKDELGLGSIPKELEKLTLIRGMNVIVPSLFNSPTSFATKVTKDGNSRFLFIVPWKDYSIEGTHWEDCIDPSEPWATHQQTADTFHEETQNAISGNSYQTKIMSTHHGFVPGTRDGKPMASDRILPHYKVVDREEDKSGDILQIVGVKFTTAFDVVKKSLQQLFPEEQIKDVLMFNNLPYGSPAQTPSTLLALYRQKYSNTLSYDQCTIAFQLFGSSLPTVIQSYIVPLTEDNKRIDETSFYIGLTQYCVGEEMACHLDDLVFRRLFPDSPATISPIVLNTLAGEMANLLQWSTRQQELEISKVIYKQEACL
ncbi:MAG: glycerol-3-phosphate dehydrogenase [Desulforhopalus sp.]|jgi:glycerol-3-phosphate dehydrogenase